MATTNFTTKPLTPLTTLNLDNVRYEDSEDFGIYSSILAGLDCENLLENTSRSRYVRSFHTLECNRRLEDWHPTRGSIAFEIQPETCHPLVALKDMHNEPVAKLTALSDHRVLKVFCCIGGISNLHSAGLERWSLEYLTDSTR